MLLNLTRNTILNAVGLFTCLALAAGVAGCRIHVDKSANGEDKNVQVDTPFGGIHVSTDQTTAADLGLPVYPGAEIVTDEENDKSADIHMGFGEWELRVKVVNYSSPDSQDKVTAFYKKALGRYGDVIACQDNAPVGKPTQTSEGLTCADDSRAHLQVNDHGNNYGYHSGLNGFELKAGSKHHQHIVGFESSAPGLTRFALVALDLPSGSGEGSGKSD
jgi:hypothetical protein